MSLMNMQLFLKSTLSDYVIEFAIKFVTGHDQLYIALWWWAAVKELDLYCILYFFPQSDK